jgi:hypothetical protein
MQPVAAIRQRDRAKVNRNLLQFEVEIAIIDLGIIFVLVAQPFQAVPSMDLLF